MSILYLSDEEHATNFQVISKRQALGQMDPIDEGEEVTITALDQKKAMLGTVRTEEYNKTLILVADNESKTNAEVEPLCLTARYLSSPGPEDGGE